MILDLITIVLQLIATVIFQLKTDV